MTDKVNGFLDVFLEQLKKQSFSIVLLVGFSFSFYQEVSQLRAEVADCNVKYRSSLIEVLQRNTEALREFNVRMEIITRKMEK